MLTRRRFLKMSAAIAAGLALPIKWSFNPAVARASAQSAGLQKFVQPLRGVGPGAISVAVPDGTTGVGGALHYSIKIQQFTESLHPSAGGNTTLWGYNPQNALGVVGVPTQRHLGGIIVGQKDVPIQITFTNNLPNNHILPVDVSNNGTAMMGNFPDAANKYDGTGLNAACTHLHGGYVPWISDGTPNAWFTPAASGGKYGPSIANGSTNYYKLLNPNLQPGQAEFYYPNRQTARMMWYHDHAHDITRLNAYSGVATAYLLRDSFEAELRNQGLPDFIENGGRELPIVIQDKIFIGSDLATVDPTWPMSLPSTPGSLWYPHVYDPLAVQPGGLPITGESCEPEMFGDTMLANGTVFPEATIQARRYRLRILNACQSRFLNLQLYIDDGSADGITLNSSHTPQNAKGPDFLVIGTEGGFLSKPVVIPSNLPFHRAALGGSLITAPAERWDIIVDFTGYENLKVILYNDAPAPFPDGDDTNDFYPSNSDLATPPTPGFGPNTRQIMRFNVVPATGNPDPPLLINPSTNLSAGIDSSLVVMWTTIPLPPPANVPVRTLTLNEDFDSYGRLIQLLGTNQQTGPGVYGRAYMAASTENPRSGSTEVWKIVNLTGDTHPIHFHLVNVQILSRQPFSTFTGTPNYNGPTRSLIGGPARGPDETELGWKETVKAHPGEVVTCIMKFDMPSIPGIPTPKSLNPNLGVSGYEYVWHCHILEHEEHDMMRPLVVTDNTYHFPVFSRP